jgi:hypothetical protein
MAPAADRTGLAAHLLARGRRRTARGSQAAARGLAALSSDAMFESLSLP